MQICKSNFEYQGVLSTELYFFVMYLIIAIIFAVLWWRGTEVDEQ